MYRKITIALHERAVLLRGGLPTRALAPGVHRLWGRGHEVLRFDTRDLVFTADPAVRAALPAGWFAELEVGARERAVLFRDSLPVSFLTPGRHRYWTVDPSVEPLVLSLEQPPPTDPRLLEALPARWLVKALIGQHQRGLLYVEGRHEGVLQPGRHVFWTTPGRPVSVTAIDMRHQLLTVSGQELMTRDKVTLRLSLQVEWAPLDPAQQAHIAAEPKAALYGLAQLALRDYVAGVELDVLLEDRTGLNRFLAERIKPEAEQLGVRVVRIGIKDVILPGEMKRLLNQVIEADKRSAAAAILRRDQAAHTRALANAAQLMADRPQLMRLKELEALKDIAGQVGEVKVVVGSDQLAKLLEPPKV